MSKILIFDRIYTNKVEISKNYNIMEAASNSKISLESAEASSSKGYATEYAIKGITPEIARRLRNGELYLVFDVIAIRHDKPTANNKIYPRDEFLDGILNSHLFQNEFRLGGVRGEEEHPDIPMPDNSHTIPEAHHINTMNRLLKVPGDKVTHSIIGYDVRDTYTIFTIKTSTRNRAIVENLLNGIAPAFSIRVIADFRRDSPDGPLIAQKIQVLGIDYVANPANYESAAIDGTTLKVVDPVDSKVINLEIMIKARNAVGFESAANDNLLFKSIDENSLVRMKEVGTETYFFIDEKPKVKPSFESVMKSLDLSIL